MVLSRSAGYGTPDFTFNADHMALVSNSAVLERVMLLITAETGIVASDNT